MSIKSEVKPIQESDVTFTIVCEPEHTPVEGNVIDTGDKELDALVEDKIINQLENGNTWAWAHVKVIGRYKGLY
jgi:hypothetical protein